MESILHELLTLKEGHKSQTSKAVPHLTFAYAPQIKSKSTPPMDMNTTASTTSTAATIKAREDNTIQVSNGMGFIPLDYSFSKCMENGPHLMIHCFNMQRGLF